MRGPTRSPAPAQSRRPAAPRPQPRPARPPPRTGRRVVVVAAAAAAPGGPSTLYVARCFAVTVPEVPGRPLLDYVRLPAQRYSVLDTQAVQREGDNGFRVSGGVQRLPFLPPAEPVGHVEILVLDDGVEQRLTRAELVARPGGGGGGGGGGGSAAVAEINATLGAVRLVNTVTARSAGGRTQLVCKLVLRGEFERGVLSRVPSDRLSGLMGWALGLALPWFLQRLAGDYTLWATGRDREASLKGGEMAALAQRMLAGGRGKLPEGVVELPVGDDEAGAGAASGAPGPGGGSGSSAGRGFGRG